MPFDRRQLLAALATGTLGPWTGPTHAQPGIAGRPVRLIVPYPAGGNADAIARVFAEALARRLETPVLVDNRPGAAGTIGAEAVARSEPDGNTLLVTVTSQLTGSALGVKPNYDAARDFVGVTGICITPLLVAAPASLPARNLQEFVVLAASRKMAFGSYGAGTSTHILQSLFARQIGADMVHVPYKGEAPMVTDLVAGQIQMGMVPPGVASSMRQAGKLRPLAVVGAGRSAFLPEVPTFAEQGYRQLDWTYGVGLYAPARVPAPVLERLERASQAVVADPQVRERYRAQSNQVWGASAEELQKRLVIDSVLWSKLMASIGPLA